MKTTGKTRWAWYRYEQVRDGLFLIDVCAPFYHRNGVAMEYLETHVRARGGDDPVYETVMTVYAQLMQRAVLGHGAVEPINIFERTDLKNPFEETQ